MAPSSGHTFQEVSTIRSGYLRLVQLVPILILKRWPAKPAFEHLVSTVHEQVPILHNFEFADFTRALLAGRTPLVPWGMPYSLPCHCPNRSGHLQGVQCALQSLPQRECPMSSFCFLNCLP